MAAEPSVETPRDNVVPFRRRPSLQRPVELVEEFYDYGFAIETEDLATLAHAGIKLPMDVTHACYFIQSLPCANQNRADSDHLDGSDAD